MIINFDIKNLTVDLSNALADDNYKKFLFNNAQINPDTKIEDLTTQDKINLVQLAIYEGFIEPETLWNLDDDSFIIH